MKTSIPFLGVLALSACQVQGSEATQHSEQAAVAACVRPRDDLEIRTSTTLCPGAYALSDAAGDGLLKVTRSGVKLTATGVTIHGSGSGFGVLASGVDRLTMTASSSARGVLSGFTSAVLIDGGKAHSVSNLDLSDNAQRPLTDSDGDFLGVWPDFPGQLALQQIGNAIVLVNVDGATIKDNLGKRQQNGLGLFSSRNVTVKGNDFGANRGWGIHLHGSSGNTITNNRADDCNLAASRYCHEVQNDGCDSAGILVIKGSNDNLVQNNSFKNGGDGIFSAAQEGDFRWGADRNRYLGNDVSGAKHLGIEATFAEGLVIENNKVHDAGRAGIWLGFSHHSVVRKNSILRSGWSGIDNESAHDLEISQNDIRDNRKHGIELRQAAPNVQESARYRIVDNVIADNAGAGISAADTHELTVEQNRLEHNGETNLRLSLAYQAAIGSGVVQSNLFRTSLGSCGNVLASCSCRAHDGDLSGCDAAAEGCAYYACSEQCHPRGTSLCDGGCAAECTGSCRDHDGTATACDAAGCAYYFCSGQCHERGTSCDQAGCSADCGPAPQDCRAHDGDLPACNDAGCAFYACSDQCHPRGSSCTEGGCTESCDALPAQAFVSKAAGADGCPWGSWIGENDWGSSDQAVIAASLCGL